MLTTSVAQTQAMLHAMMERRAQETDTTVPTSKDQPHSIRTPAAAGLTTAHACTDAGLCSASNDRQDSELCSAQPFADVHEATQGSRGLTGSSSFWFSGVNFFMFSITCTPTRCTVHDLRDKPHMSCRDQPLTVIVLVGPGQSRLPMCALRHSRRGIHKLPGPQYRS